MARVSPPESRERPVPGAQICKNPIAIAVGGAPRSARIARRRSRGALGRSRVDIVGYETGRIAANRPSRRLGCRPFAEQDTTAFAQIQEFRPAVRG
jgi:hypothetical protein